MVADRDLRPFGIRRGRHGIAVSSGLDLVVKLSLGPVSNASRCDLPRAGVDVPLGTVDEAEHYEPVCAPWSVQIETRFPTVALEHGA